MPSKMFIRLSVYLILLLGSSSTLLAQDVDSAEVKEKQSADAPSEADYDALSKLLTNSVFEGHFTVDGQDAAPKKEQYFLKKVKKLSTGDYWLFQTRIKYGDHDVTVPLSLPIKWSAKTPVSTVDNVTIPGLGTFNARVLIADGKYAGTWQHGKVGGHLYGSIKQPVETPPTEAKQESSDSTKAVE